ncbi:pyridoxal phosphate-dependent transferase [Hyaloraphidium curvatum]|nr:pyridoxal phosphate-dependent transferase [Hyaloraphidium curvatum]
MGPPAARKAAGHSLVLPAISTPPAVGWPRVGSSPEFRIIAGMNLLLVLPVVGTCLQAKPWFPPALLCLLHSALCASLVLLGPGAHPLYIFARVVAVHLPFRPVPGAPKRFSLVISVGLTITQAAWLATGSGPRIPWFLLVLASANIANSIFGLCIACLIYSDLLVRFNLLPAHMYTDYKRPYSRDEVLGVYARWLPAMYLQFATPLDEGQVKATAQNEEPEFEIYCANGVCKMVPIKREGADQGNMTTITRRRPRTPVAKAPEANLEDMWKSIVTPLAKPLSEVVTSGRRASIPAPGGLAEVMGGSAFIPIAQRAQELEEGVRTALNEFRGKGGGHHHGVDMSLWTDELLAEWSSKFLGSETKRAEPADGFDAGLTFKHPFFDQAMWTAQSMLAEREMIDAFTDDRADAEVTKRKVVPVLTDPAYISERDAAYARFVDGNPTWESEPVRRLRDLRATEYAVLDRTGAVYMDYTAGGLPARSQLDALLLLLRENVLGNPHSACPASLAASFLDKRAREAVLSFFHASEDEYDVIFTQNASGACRIVADNFVFSDSSTFLYCVDNHTSIVGIREWARKKGARIDTVPIVRPDMRIDEKMLRQKLEAITTAGPGPHLFAYPAQSNVTGVKHPLKYVRWAQELGWIVLCDVAAFVPSSRLDLGVVKPQFAPLSFYKMFGFPTGLGALLVRKDAYPLLQRHGFLGGTVRVVTVHDEGHFWLDDGHPRFEDGTVNYLNIPAVEIGLRYLDRIGIDAVTSLVRCLTGWLIEALLLLTHPNGRSLVTIYGPHDTVERGGTIVVNLRDANGDPIQAKVVEQEANHENVNVRVGCFCNPGAITVGLELEAWKVAKDMKFGEVCVALPKGPLGMIRISIGLASNFDDVFRMYMFMKGFLDPEVVNRANAAFMARYVAPGGLC